MAKEVIGTAVQLTYVPEEEPRLVASPSVIVAEGGKVPRTDISLVFYRDGQAVNPNSWYGLFGMGSSTGYGPAGTPYSGVHWIFNTSVHGYQVRGTVTQDIVIDCCAILDGKEYHVPVSVCMTSAPSEPRNPSWTPPPMLWGEYPANYQFQNGDSYTDASGTVHECERKDVVCTADDNGKMLFWSCKESHRKGCGSSAAATSANNDMPHGGGTPSKYWQATDGGPFNLLATAVLLARNAVIDVLTSNAIRVMKSDGTTVSVQLSGGSWPIMCGSATADDAPTKISDDGTFYSRKAVIEGDVVFGGIVKPKLTTITSSNYKNFRVRWNDVFGAGDDPDNPWILDFRALSGLVLLDATLGNVAQSELALYMVVPCQYQNSNGTKTYGKPADFIGARMRIANGTTKTFNITGLCTNDRTVLSGGQSPIVSSLQEIDLECIIGKVNGRAAIGWYIHYQGPTAS